jgi:hypothetical protein
MRKGGPTGRPSCLEQDAPAAAQGAKARSKKRCGGSLNLDRRQREGRLQLGDFAPRLTPLGLAPGDRRDRRADIKGGGRKYLSGRPIRLPSPGQAAPAVGPEAARHLSAWALRRTAELGGR